MNWKNATDSKRPEGQWWAVWGYRLAAAVMGLLLLGLDAAKGCGPGFPNWLLSDGDQALLAAPEGNFAAELARMQLSRPRFQALPPEGTNSHAAQSAEAEVADLRKALQQAGTSKEEINRICREHQSQRRQLAAFIEAQNTWKESHSGSSEEPATSATDASRSGGGPAMPPLEIVPGLPGEFADYFEGFIAWQNPLLADKQAAQAAWERLLARPAAERRYKSTWAAFMLGKFWEDKDAEKAVGYFQQVRELARQGYRDALGLTAASLGLEARVRLAQTNYEAATELYLEQLATGDPTATDSLRIVAQRALTAQPAALLALAKNPRTQKVITAYVISRERENGIYQSGVSDSDEPPKPTESVAAHWLKAAEAAGSHDMDSVEALALAAYRANEMGAAQRWVRRAPNTPVTQWLQAKLLLRAGKLQSAAALLAKVSPLFPIIHETTNAPAPADRKDTLRMGGECSYFPVSAERQVQGELGALRLARGEYTQALDLLLNAGFWMDAAYVAERVLTTEELKGYVDRFWPPVSPEQEAQERERFGGSEVCPAKLRTQIRYLLARRLTRELHGDQARPYYPAEWVGAFDQLAAHLRAGWDESQPPAVRAAELFQAALLTRTNGLELLGTEVAPDWHYHLGDYDGGVTGEDRGTNAQFEVVRPTEDELRRNAQHVPEPNARFHYRYQAAELAWEAAKLLPENNDQTAYLLWKGGSFVKYRNPQYADRFYKALVNRNRQTALGAEADRQRWFPLMDTNGNILPKPAQAKEPEEQPGPPTMEEPTNGTEPDSEEASPAPSPASEATQGYEYVVQAGDTLSSIVQRLTRAGVAVSIRDLVRANPGLEGSRLLVGQILFVPSPRQ